MKRHQYAIEVVWTGGNSEGTKSYTSYKRDHTIAADGKAPILGSSDPAFRGDPTRYNPEEMLVASLSACHMLWFLHLCAVNHVTVLAYRDVAYGLMEEAEDGSGSFVRVVLKPITEISQDCDPTTAVRLHEDAHAFCFVANSVKFPVVVQPEIIQRTAPPNTGS